MFKENPKAELITYISHMKESEQKNLLTVLKRTRQPKKETVVVKRSNARNKQHLSPRITAWYKSLPKFETGSDRKKLIYEAIEEKRTARR